MGKNDFLSPKAIGNRIKAKGLTKLRWYCQMCQKACRDENGFKCHLTSDSHKRQMEVFGMNPQRVVEGFSEEFESNFLEHLRRAHPFSRVAATVVYNEFINEKNHIHMNSTKWLTLTEFVKYLGREGKCKVDETEKGWFIAIVQKDGAEEMNEKRRVKRERAELEAEERHQRALAEQIERAQAAAEAAASGTGPAGGEMQRDDFGAPLGFALPVARPEGAGTLHGPSRLGPRPAAFDDDGGERAGPSGRDAGGAPPPKKSKLEELMERDQRAKAAAAARPPLGGPPAAAPPGREEPWVREGIVVKIMSRALREAGYYKAKGVVVAVLEGGHVAEIEVLDSGDVVRVDQAELETVIPQPGGTVVLLRGSASGARATLLRIDTDKFQAQVQVSGGPRDGDTFWAEYEHISKLQIRGGGGC